MTMKNKLMSLCLAVSILSGCLWGCAAPSGTAGGSTGEQQTKSKTQEEKQQEGPMGRYAESSISISLEEGETAADIIQSCIRSKTKKLPDTYGRVKSGRNRTTACWRDWSFRTGPCI
jgi:hypothetical protein